MKKNIWIIGVMCCLCSCRDYLDIKPYGKTIPQTAEEFSALLHQTLNKLDYGESNCILNTVGETSTLEMYADNLEANLTEYPGGNFLPVYVGADVDKQTSRYSEYYALVRNCNIIIGEMKDRTSEMGRQVLGTAYAIRGICYYEMLRRYCEPYQETNKSQAGLPIVAHFDMEAQPRRSTFRQTVDFIEENFLNALEYEVSDDIYRIKADVVHGYFARLYFWTKQWDKVLTETDYLLKKYPIIDLEGYKEMMESPYTAKGNILLKSNIYTNTSTDLSNSSTMSTMKYRPASIQFISLFDEQADVRYSMDFNSKRQAIKLPKGCMRSAEWLLMRAEAFYHTGNNQEALSLVNLLRRNRIAGCVDYTMDHLPAVPDTQLIRVDCDNKPLTPLLNLILNERRKEFFLEGDRWFELKRNGSPEFWRTRDGKKYVTQKFLYTFPLPITDIELVEGLIQNEGYTDIY